MAKEAKARIRINELLQRSGWRFFDADNGPANIALEVHVKLKKKDLDALGDDFEKTKKGFIDYNLLDDGGFPVAVLEAKQEKLDPLTGKEQARKYARSQNVRFVILSNGNLHYFWDLEQGNPTIITEFPTPQSLGQFHTFQPNPDALVSESVGDDYVAVTQDPYYRKNPRWLNAALREDFIKDANLKFLRPYQLRAIAALQAAAGKGQTRFLFEMATGTGKTLVVDPSNGKYSGLPHVSAENMESGTGRLLPLRTAAEDRVMSSNFLFEPGSVLYSKIRPYLVKAALVDFRGVCSADMYPLNPNHNVVLPEFLLRLLLTDEFTKYADNCSRRARMPKLNREQLFAYDAVLPPLAKQREIVAELDSERALVDSNRELIARFERKMQAKLSEIWGETDVK